MKRLLIALALASATACTPIPAPNTVADLTTLDEQGALGVELAYRAFRTAVEFGVDARLVQAPLARCLAALDNTAYSAVQATRAAYRAGNASNYLAASEQARTAISTALATLGRRSCS